jgi:hypothetical protein
MEQLPTSEIWRAKLAATASSPVITQRPQLNSCTPEHQFNVQVKAAAKLTSQQPRPPILFIFCVVPGVNVPGAVNHVRPAAD